MINDTHRAFGYPDTLVREYDHWLVLLRPKQVTLGSLVMAAKSDATDFAKLSREAFTEMAEVVSDIERSLQTLVSYRKINYLMLMMVDPHVHLHIFPRYDDDRTIGACRIADRGWPGAPDLGSGQTLAAEEFSALLDVTRTAFICD